MPELSIVMPCYNEEGCIEEVVASWLQEASRHTASWEMIVVDDGSKDDSGAILDRMAVAENRLRVVHQANRGHGPALLHAYAESKGEWIFHTDSDRQFLPEDFERLWRRRNESPYLLGIRADRKDPTHRLFLTSVVRGLVRFVCGAPARDANIPYKLIRRDWLDRILSLIPADTFAPSILMTVAAFRLGANPLQIEVRHLPRTTGETVLHPFKLLRVSLRSTWELLRFRFCAL